MPGGLQVIGGARSGLHERAGALDRCFREPDRSALLCSAENPHTELCGGREGQRAQASREETGARPLSRKPPPNAHTQHSPIENSVCINLKHSTAISAQALSLFQTQSCMLASLRRCCRSVCPTFAAPPRTNFLRPNTRLATFSGARLAILGDREAAKASVFRRLAPPSFAPRRAGLAPLPPMPDARSNDRTHCVVPLARLRCAPARLDRPQAGADLPDAPIALSGTFLTAVSSPFPNKHPQPAQQRSRWPPPRSRSPTRSSTWTATR